MIDAKTYRLDGRLALVTGSSTGIGFALARGLAQAGARVVLNARGAEKLAAAVARLQAEGHTVHSAAFDVAEPADVEAAVARIEAELGPIHVLVNNAGLTRRAAVHELSMDDWHLVQRTNVDGVFVTAQAVARRMIPRGAGRIINIGSVMCDFGRPGTAAYTASKGAVKMLTKAMAIELARHGITVNAIAPGYFATELTAPLRADAAFDSWIKGRTPAGRWGEVEELAPAALFLASDAAAYVNGHVLFVDGGMTATL